jgi:radical SAM superfamily enzyme YgiQ (UPF0313 family)
VARDPELLSLLQASGCQYLLIGFESFSRGSLGTIRKTYTDPRQYRDVVETLHTYGIAVQGCFIFGFDDDDRTTFQDTIDLINESGIDIPRLALLTPYPNTNEYKRLKAESRLLHEKWEYYDTQHVVIKPAMMSPFELDELFRSAWKETFTLRNSFSRSLNSGKKMPVTFVGNLAYRLYIKRLLADKERFPEGVDKTAVGSAT